jgi:hypothetical protein
MSITSETLRHFIQTCCHETLEEMNNRENWNIEWWELKIENDMESPGEIFRKGIWLHPYSSLGFKDEEDNTPIY